MDVLSLGMWEPAGRFVDGGPAWQRANHTPEGLGGWAVQTLRSHGTAGSKLSALEIGWMTCLKRLRIRLLSMSPLCP
jgi:hypothetical protein